MTQVEMKFEAHKETTNLTKFANIETLREILCRIFLLE